MIYHFVQPHVPTSAHDREYSRLMRAQATWSLPRIDYLPEELPFVADIVDYCFNRVDYDDWGVFTNADSCLVSDVLKIVEREIEFGAATRADPRAFYSHRRDFNRVVRKHLTRADILDKGNKFIGVDAVVMRKDWWLEHSIGGSNVVFDASLGGRFDASLGGTFDDSLIYPKVYIGNEGWDWIFKVMIDGVNWGSGAIKEIVYHEFHGTPRWLQNRKTDKLNLWNRKTCWDWAKAYCNGREGRMSWADICEFWPTLKEIS